MREKLKTMSFRGALRAEESLFSWTLNQRGIPRFARNDEHGYFFRNLFSRPVFGPAAYRSFGRSGPEFAKVW